MPNGLDGDLKSAKTISFSQVLGAKSGEWRSNLGLGNGAAISTPGIEPGS